MLLSPPSCPAQLLQGRHGVCCLSELHPAWCGSPGVYASSPPYSRVATSGAVFGSTNYLCKSHHSLYIHSHRLVVLSLSHCSKGRKKKIYGLNYRRRTPGLQLLWRVVQHLLVKESIQTHLCDPQALGAFSWPQAEPAAPSADPLWSKAVFWVLKNKLILCSR